MELMNFISVYDDILSETINKKLLKVCKNFDWEDALVGEGPAVLNKDIRNVKKHDLSDIHNSMTSVHWYNVLEKIFKNNLTKYVNNNKFIDIYSDRIETIQVLKYNKNNHYVWHYDGGMGFNRTFSLIYFLN